MICCIKNFDLQWIELGFAFATKGDKPVLSFNHHI
jgi:hypothetical protein